MTRSFTILILLVAATTASAQDYGLDVGGDATFVNEIDGSSYSAVIGDDSSAFSGSISACGVRTGGELIVRNEVDGNTAAVVVGDRSHAVAGSVVLGDDRCY